MCKSSNTLVYVFELCTSMRVSVCVHNIFTCVCVCVCACVVCVCVCMCGCICVHV